MCSVPPVGYSQSLLTLANNTCVRLTFGEVLARFNKLFKRKAHLHHYTATEGMDLSEFTDSVDSLHNVVKEYQTLEQQMSHPPPAIPRKRYHTRSS